MGIQGTGLKNTNPRLRLLMIFFGGLIAFGAVIYWRQAALRQADYVEIPVHQTASASNELHSKNFQIDVQDASPTAK